MLRRYRVKIWNPDLPGKGFITSYRLASAAKLVVKRCNDLYARDGSGVRAEYLGRKDYAL